MRELLNISEQDGPIDPAEYASWLYFAHNNNDRGLRYPGWWAHNENFKIDPNGDEISVKFSIANSGWADVTMMRIDYFVPHPHHIFHIHDDTRELKSGESENVDFKFTIEGNIPEDNLYFKGLQPSIIIRITDITTPAPSKLEIMSCLGKMNTAGQYESALAQLFSWKNVPGIFSYPCCALYPGNPT